MPMVELGVNYEDVKNLDDFPTVPGGTYQFTITSGKLGQTTSGKTPGRNKIDWILTVQHPDTGQNVNIFHSTVLPYTDPATGETITTGLFVLVGLCSGVGKPWMGTGIDPDEYIGLGGSAVVIEEDATIVDPTGAVDEAGRPKRIPDPSGKKRNSIAKIIH